MNVLLDASSVNLLLLLSTCQELRTLTVLYDLLPNTN